MRVILLVVLCCVGGIQITRAQRRRVPLQNPLRLRHVAALRQGNPARALGPVHFHAVLSKLPAKYVPLTKADEYAAFKAAATVPEILRYFPNVYSVKQIGPINIDLPDFWLRGKLYLNNLAVRGINQASLQHVEVRLRNNRIDFNAHAPRISADVNFDLEGSLGVVPLYLTGSVSLGVQDLNPSGAVGIKKVSLPLVGEVYQVDAADVSVDVQNIAINIKSGGASDMDQDMDAIKAQILEDVKDEVADILLGSVLKEVNKELAKIPAAEIDAFLTKNY